MKKNLFLLLLVLLSSYLGHAQAIVLNNTDPGLDTLFHLPDSSIAKIVDAVYIEIYYLDNSNVVKHTAIKALSINCCGSFRLPLNLLTKNIQTLGYTLMFNSVLNDYFKSDDSSVFIQLPLSGKEIAVIKRLTALYLERNWRKETITEESYITMDDGTKKKIYTKHVVEVNWYSYSTPPASIIKCRISTTPPGAIAYVIPRFVWSYKWHLGFPPKKEQLNVAIKDNLFPFRVGNTQTPLVSELNEQSYIVLYDHNGVYTFAYLEPSTMYKERNVLNSNIQ